MDSREQIKIFLSLFQGRRDVFAIRWEKGGKAGYTPACNFDPFSFLFLWTGEQRYHIILETLDTEEATYVWHSEKNKSELMKIMSEIDNRIHFIRLNGREAFLKTNPKNFSKIVHDYSEDNKGFITWKSQLEELLF